MNFRTTRCTVLLLMSLAAPARAQDAARQLHRIFEDHWTWRKEQFPDFAMSLGDYSNAQRITDNSLAAIEGRNQYKIELLRRLHAVGKTALDPAGRLNYELFEVQLQNDITNHRYRMWLAPIGGRSGPQQRVPQMHERVRFGSYEDYANYLTRLEQVPAALRNTTALLKIGMQEGRTPPRVALQGMGGQFEALLDGGLRALAEPLQDMPAAIDPQQQQQLRVRFESESFPAVAGAMRDFGRFVVQQYIPACRRDIAAASLPDGQAYYAHQLRVFTTTDLSAREIHELGLAEVARIRAEMIQVIRGSDFMQHQPRAALLAEQELFEAFVAYLRGDPRFYHRSEEELLRGYRDVCKRIDAELPALFGLLPRLPYGVRKIPDFMAPNQTTAYYSRGDIGNAQAGYFYANTYALDQRPKYEMVALALHEAVPGHHFQVALAQELENLPQFRRHAWFTAFGEGWALYAERLGMEMDLFADPYDNFGRLLYEMWRACRLVVDPGMHALGWSRDRAVRFMIDNTALSALNINNEVDRYISWPGQATAYKIGELRIRRLRARAHEERLQDRFNVRAFHDVVLGAGSLPLDILERRVGQWIAGQEHTAARAGAISAQILQAIRGLLDHHGITYREVQHEPTYTSEQSARARGESVHIGGKALLLKVGEGFHLFVLSAALKLDSQAVRRHFGVRQSRFANREELLRLTGLVPGSVPPFGRPILPFELFADQSVRDNDRIAFNAGSLTDSVIMDTADYLRIARPTIFRFAVPQG